MFENETRYRVVLSNTGLPPSQGRVVIRLDESSRSFILTIYDDDGRRPHDEAKIEHAANVDDVTVHFTGQSARGYKFDLTFHTNHLGRRFVYGKTSAGDRGGTGVWVAEEQEAGRPGKKPKGK